MQLTPYWTKLRYHKIQNALWKCPTRYAAVVAGRGSGKTELARRRTVIHLAVKRDWPDPIYLYCLPTFAQAKKVAWTPINNLIPDSWIVKNGRNVSELSITTIFGSKLYIVGLDKPHRIEGLQIDGCVLDESSDQRPGTFAKTIRPMLTHRSAWVWRIGVPKRSGVGRIEFQEFFERGTKEVGSNISSFWWESADILTEEEIEDAMRDLDTQDFDEQFRAKWLNLGGTIYHAFSSENIRDTAKYDPSLPILVGCDFNVDPMSWVVCHKTNEGKLHVFDEVFVRNTHTEAVLKQLHRRYKDHKAGWKFYGDASGRARKTNAPKTDYLAIKNSELFIDKKVYFARKNPHIRDRFSTVNAALCNAKQEYNTLINPVCVRLINDLSMMAYKEKTSEPECYDGTDIGHMSDGFGYLVMRVMPMKLQRTTQPSIVTV